mgnify:CR=1 FL=1
MIGIRYVDELFAVKRIPKEFWLLIRQDFRYDGTLRKAEGFVVLLLPAIICSSLIVYFEVLFKSDFYSLLIAAATLFVGFSMNSVLLLLKYSDKEDASPLLIDQTRNLISYLLYLGVILAFLGLVGYALTAQAGTESIVGDTTRIFHLIMAAISVFVLVHFLVVVLFLPARIFTIIEQSVEKSYR